MIKFTDKQNDSRKEETMSNQFEGTHLSSKTPAYPMPPYTYKNNRTLSVVFRTSPEVLRALVPEPLLVNPGGQIIMYVGALNAVAPVPFDYYEAGIMIPVSDGHEEGVYMPVLYLDKAPAIVAGRELWGFPKFPADLSLKEEAGVVHAYVKSGGTSLVDATLHLGQPIPPMNVLPHTVFLMKTIPSAKGPSEYDVKQLTTAVLRDEINMEMRPGHATLRLGSTPFDPLGEIPVLEIENGIYTVGGMVLDYGRVVYDYLEKR